MQNGFLIESLKIVNKDKVLFDICFTNKQVCDIIKPFTTVVIGTNGTGKSYLLTVLAELFRAINNKISFKDVNLRYDFYCIEYVIGDNHYHIEIMQKSNIIAVKNGEVIEASKIELPYKVLAVSYMVNDKFVFKAQDTENEDIYEYLGIRQTSNAAWTSSIIRRVSDSLVELFIKSDFTDKAKEILSFLSFDNKISLKFEPEGKTLFTRKMQVSKLNKIAKKIQKQEDYRAFSVNKLVESNYTEIAKFINSASKSGIIKEINGKSGIELTLDFDNDKKSMLIRNEYRVIRNLLDLKLLKPPKLVLYKDNQDFDFEYASSGEKHFLFTLINIASKIKPNSLILIDEPEISLHPNWQMNYINYIKKVFREYKSCHFILATHSHYIVSDLEPDSSSLVKLSVDSETNIRNSQLIEYSTYAWSAENILYNVFHVRTTRNYYFEMDLRNLISLIEEKSSNLEELTLLVNKLKKFIIDKNDPMNLILNEAERYIDYAKKTGGKN